MLVARQCWTTKASVTGILQARERMAELGATLETTDDEDVPDSVQMCDALKEYICKQVEHVARNKAAKKWSIIRSDSADS